MIEGYNEQQKREQINQVIFANLIREAMWSKTFDPQGIINEIIDSKKEITSKSIGKNEWTAEKIEAHKKKQEEDLEWFKEQDRKIEAGELIPIKVFGET